MKESFQKNRDFLMLAGWTAFTVGAAGSIAWHGGQFLVKTLAWPVLFFLLMGPVFGIGTEAFHAFKRRVVIPLWAKWYPVIRPKLPALLQKLFGDVGPAQ